MIAAGLLQAKLAWQEPLQLVENYNLRFAGNAADNNKNMTALVTSRIEDGLGTCLIQIYYDNGLSVWPEAKNYQNSEIYIRVCFSSDNCLFVLRRYWQAGVSQELRLEKFNLDGSSAWAGGSVTMLQETDSNNGFKDYIMKPDNQGGAHLLARRNSSGFPPEYQHINAAGELLRPISDLTFLPGPNLGGLQLDVLDSGDVIISYLIGTYGSYQHLIRRLDSAGNTIWTHYEPCSDTGVSVYIVVDGDGSIYVLRHNSTLNNVVRYDQDLNAVWTVALQLPQESGFEVISKRVEKDGSLVLALNVSHNLRLICLSQEGEQLWPQDLILGILTSLDEIQTCPDGSGGYFTVNKRRDGVAIEVNHVNATGEIWTEPKIILTSGDETYNQSGFYVCMRGELVRILYPAGDTHQYGIYVQMLDPAGELSYSLPGMALISADQGQIIDLQIHPINQNQALVLIVEGSHVQTALYHLFYNYLNADSSLKFGKHRLLGSSKYPNPDLIAIPFPGGGFEIYWKSNPDFFYQKLSPQGEILLGNGGLVIDSSPQTSYLGLYQGSVYAVKILSYKYLYLQKYTEGSKQWDTDRFVADMINDSNHSVHSFNGIFGNYLVWTDAQNHYTDHMIYFNAFTAEGLPYFESPDGIPIMAGLAGNEGISFTRAIEAKGKLYLEYKYCEIRPDKSATSTYHYRYGAFKIDKSGQIELLWGNYSEAYSQNTVICGKEIYVQAYPSNPNLLEIRKQDFDGSYIWNNSVTAPEAWQNHAFYENPDGNLVMLSSHKNGVNYDYRYFIINSQGHLQTPADSYLFTSPKNYTLNVFPALGGNLLGLQSPSSSSYILYYVTPPQGFAIPEYTPEPVLQISGIHPNPFKGSSRLSVKLEEEGPASLEIYNIRGQLLKRQDYPQLLSGYSDLYWDGTDHQGRACAKGIYFFKVSSSGSINVIKGLKL